MSPQAPNILLLITDQQRYPCHWPDGPGLASRADAERPRGWRTPGSRFRNAFCNTSMCSPSRATLLTGRYPAQHGVTLTHTQADLRPDPRNAAGRAGDARRTSCAARTRRAGGRFAGSAAGLLQLGPKSGGEPELRPETPNLAQLLRARGYEVAYKGKWHLTHPSGGGVAARRLDAMPTPSACDDDYGFADWEPPDAGENAKAEHFGGGNAGPLGAGLGRGLHAPGSRRWLGRADLPEPFCLVVSLVNPHDVLGYPAQYVGGGYTRREFRDLGVELPPTLDEDLRDKPTVHELMRMGMAAYLGPLERRARRSSTTSTSTPTCTGWSTRRSAGSSTRSATRRTRRRCARAR